MSSTNPNSMSTLAASNLDKTPPKINQPPSLLLSLFSSLPNDMILEIIARVPKRYYPILSCVSNKLQILVHSLAIQKMRSLLDKDSLYIYFFDNTTCTRNWFRMEKNQTGNLFVPKDFPFLKKTDYSYTIAVGPEIFFIGGDYTSTSLWIFDSRSGKCQQGPSMHMRLNHKRVGLVHDKIYLIGRDNCRKFYAEFFDLKRKIWKLAPIPKGKRIYAWIDTLDIVPANVVLDGKVTWLHSRHISSYDTRDGSCNDIWLHSHHTTSYRTRDGSCKDIQIANNIQQMFPDGACVIDNVLYVYYHKLGLLWYDFKLRQCKIVEGLDHIHESVCMAEYYGKLACLWTEDGVVGSETKEIWCKMIALDRNEVGIHGTAEPSQLVGIVPRHYILHKCLSLLG